MKKLSIISSMEILMYVLYCKKISSYGGLVDVRKHVV